MNISRHYSCICHDNSIDVTGDVDIDNYVCERVEEKNYRCALNLLGAATRWGYSPIRHVNLIELGMSIRDEEVFSCACWVASGLLAHYPQKVIDLFFAKLPSATSEEQIVLATFLLEHLIEDHFELVINRLEDAAKEKIAGLSEALSACWISLSDVTRRNRLNAVLISLGIHETAYVRNLSLPQNPG